MVSPSSPAARPAKIARMAVTPGDGKELPDWFVVELFRDLPRLADKRNG